MISNRLLRRIAVSLGIVAGACSSACAGLEVRRVKNDCADECARGFRYYPLAPYLLVKSDNKGSLESKLIYLPDTTRKMSIRPTATLASNNVVLKFDKGALTDSSATIDTAAVPKAVVDALAKVAKEIVKGAMALAVARDRAGPAEVAPPVYLFSIVNDKGTFALRGGPPSVGTTPVDVRVTPPAPKS